MRVGTKSILFGVHSMFLHPLFVAAAWWRLYGFPYDPRLWFAFALHDAGYFGRSSMEGPGGETHVELGAKIMGAIFGAKWEEFCLRHSRYYARARGLRISKLCVADKLASHRRGCTCRWPAPAGSFGNTSSVQKNDRPEANTSLPTSGSR